MALGTGITHWAISVGSSVLHLLQGMDTGLPSRESSRAAGLSILQWPQEPAATRGQVPACKACEARPIGNAKPKESGVQEPSSCSQSYDGLSPDKSHPEPFRFRDPAIRMMLPAQACLCAISWLGQTYALVSCHTVGFYRVSCILAEWMPLRYSRAQLGLVVLDWPDSVCVTAPLFGNEKRKKDSTPMRLDPQR